VRLNKKRLAAASREINLRILIFPFLPEGMGPSAVHPSERIRQGRSPDPCQCDKRNAPFGAWRKESRRNRSIPGGPSLSESDGAGARADDDAGPAPVQGARSARLGVLARPGGFRNPE